jgi:hypothetical protein
MDMGSFDLLALSPQMAKRGYLGPKSALHLLKNAQPAYPFARNNPRNINIEARKHHFPSR